MTLRNDPRKQATALTYDTKKPDAAPRVVAKGYGLVAEMIVQRAKDAGLYVHESPDMVSLLMQVDLDARIRPRCIRRWRNCWHGSTGWKTALSKDRRRKSRRPPESQRDRPAVLSARRQTPAR